MKNGVIAGGVGIWLDEIVPCLKDTETGAIKETVVFRGRDTVFRSGLVFPSLMRRPSTWAVTASVGTLSPGCMVQIFLPYRSPVVDDPVSDPLPAFRTLALPYSCTPEVSFALGVYDRVETEEVDEAAASRRLAAGL